MSIEDVISNEEFTDVDSASSAMSEHVRIIPSSDDEHEQFLSTGDRIELSFALVNGGKYAFYDGGSAVMTYHAEAPDGGQKMYTDAVRSMDALRVVLKEMQNDLIEKEDV